MLKRLVPAAALAVFLGHAGAGFGAPIDDAMKTVEQTRGLRFLHPVKQESVNRRDLPRLLRAQMEKEMPYSPEDFILILRSLQLVDGESAPLLDKMLALYQEQVLAFYDPLTHVYFSVPQLPGATTGVVDDESLRGSVMIHELTHALQDQRFDIGTRDRAIARDGDAALAYHALIEGEATLVMMSSLLEKSGQRIDTLARSDAAIDELSKAAAADRTIGPEVPRFFVESLKFPYIDGLTLCLLAYRRGGWKEIDRIYANPPATTREVIHPAEYFARLDAGKGDPAPFDLAPLVTSTHVLSVEHVGFFVWKFLLGTHAEGWQNDKATIVQDVACNPTVLVTTTWDSPARARDFASAYEALLRGRRLDPMVRVDGNSVRAAYGADHSVMEGFINQ